MHNIQWFRRSRNIHKANRFRVQLVVIRRDTSFVSEIPIFPEITNYSSANRNRCKMISGKSKYSETRDLTRCEIHLPARASLTKAKGVA
ncbi:hypothetical protein CEXT_675531 [Caerostris extrusa]|uniref:Uncharacterized protein n=1 Tax=Caerostris extrusa TaxID=172846 RepID=A0AAV4SQY6_CAEEX|nr:hypothetical protein CEXT_675531 [Caerostris extrusa]